MSVALWLFAGFVVCVLVIVVGLAFLLADLLRGGDQRRRR